MTAKHFDKLQGWRFVLFNGCMGLGHALIIFNAGAYIAMLPRVAGGLGVPPSFATWTQTDYMIGLALSFPVGGWLARRLGEYKPFVVALLLFALASVVCATASQFYVYLAARIVLGFAGGMSLPLGQSLLIKEYPDTRKSVGIGVWSVFTLTPFTFGPPLGGWIADTLGWRWLFWGNVPVALVIALCVWLLLHPRRSVRIRHRFDGVGFIGCSCLLLGLQTLCNQGNDWDWWQADYLRVLSAVLSVIFVYWLLWEGSVRRPFLDIRLFAQRNFCISVFILCIGFMQFQGLLSLLIVQLQLSLGYSSLLAGLVFLPMAICAKPMASVFHEVVQYFDARWLVCLNLLGFATTYFWLSQLDTPDAFAQLFWPKVLEGACLGSFFVPLTTLMLHGLAPNRHWRAIELASLLRIAAGALGITLQGIVFYRRVPQHATRYAEQNTLLDSRVEQTWQTLQEVGFEELVAWAKFAKLAQRQAMIHGINDAFYLAGWVFIGLAVLVWCAEPTRVPVKRSVQQAQIREEQELLGEEP